MEAKSKHVCTSVQTVAEQNTPRTDKAHRISFFPPRGRGDLSFDNYKILNLSNTKSIH